MKVKEPGSRGFTHGRHSNLGGAKRVQVRIGCNTGGGGSFRLNVYKSQVADFLRADFSQSTQMFPLDVSDHVSKNVSVFNLNLRRANSWVEVVTQWI